MKRFNVQGVEIAVPRERAFAFVADPALLPRWAEAFETASNARAVLRTPHGRVEVGLQTMASPEHGTIDWRMTFPDGSVAMAHSRLVSIDGERCAYTFVLTPPPVPLEALEGALDAQSEVLSRELASLKRLLEADHA